MHNGEIMVACLAQDCPKIDAVRYGIDQFTLRNHGGLLSGTMAAA
jgi:hypothetical protein